MYPTQVPNTASGMRYLWNDSETSGRDSTVHQRSTIAPRIVPHSLLLGIFSSSCIFSLPDFRMMIVGNPSMRARAIIEIGNSVSAIGIKYPY